MGNTTCTVPTLYDALGRRIGGGGGRGAEKSEAIEDTAYSGPEESARANE